jgi:cytosine/uracil/thiamine/allantoin permease
VLVLVSSSPRPVSCILMKTSSFVNEILTLYIIGWSVSILGTNIAANMVRASLEHVLTVLVINHLCTFADRGSQIPFGSDSSMLFPRFITIPRGQLLVEFLGFAICPWKILASAGTFTTFLSGYGLLQVRPGSFRF